MLLDQSVWRIGKSSELLQWLGRDLADHQYDLRADSGDRAAIDLWSVEPLERDSVPAEPRSPRFVRFHANGGVAEAGDHEPADVRDAMRLEQCFEELPKSAERMATFQPEPISRSASARLFR